MNTHNKNYIVYAVSAGVLLPLLATAGDGGIASTTSIDCSGADCDFSNLLAGVEAVIDFIIYGLAMPVGAVMFAVAGWKMMTAGDNPGAVSEAKTIFKYVAIGLFFALAAWLLVSALLDGLQVQNTTAPETDFNLLQ